MNLNIKKNIQRIAKWRIQMIKRLMLNKVKSNKLNLNVIQNFIKKYKIPIGYSGHEVRVSHQSLPLF